MKEKIDMQLFDQAIKDLRSSLSSIVARHAEETRALEEKYRGAMTVEEAAEYLGLSPRGLKNLEYRGELVPLRQGRRVTYTRRLLDDYRTWLEGKACARLRRA